MRSFHWFASLLLSLVLQLPVHAVASMGVSDQVEAASPTTVQTVGGALRVVAGGDAGTVVSLGKRRLLVEDQRIITVAATLPAGQPARWVVLEINTRASACPILYRVVSFPSGAPRVTAEFGNCSLLKEGFPAVDGGVLRLELRGTRDTSWTLSKGRLEGVRQVRRTVAGELRSIVVSRSQEDVQYELRLAGQVLVEGDEARQLRMESSGPAGRPARWIVLWNEESCKYRVLDARTTPASLSFEFGDCMRSLDSKGVEERGGGALWIPLRSTGDGELVVFDQEDRQSRGEREGRALASLREGGATPDEGLDPARERPMRPKEAEPPVCEGKGCEGSAARVRFSLNGGDVVVTSRDAAEMEQALRTHLQAADVDYRDRMLDAIAPAFIDSDGVVRIGLWVLGESGGSLVLQYRERSPGQVLAIHRAVIERKEAAWVVTSVQTASSRRRPPSSAATIHRGLHGSGSRSVGGERGE